MISNLLLQRILDEAAEDDKKKKKPEDEEKPDDTKGDDQKEDQTDDAAGDDTKGEEQTDENGDNEGDNPDDPGDTEDNPEGSDGEAAEGDEPAPEDGETPADGGEDETGGAEGDSTETGDDAGGGDGMSDFSMDGDDPMGEGEEDLGPAPDGLPEADAEEVDDTDLEGETNIQTNIMKLSKLDRALAKKTVGENLASLRSTINAAIGVIDRNEAVIEPEIRESTTTRLNNLLGELESFILHRFPILNYEDSLTQYLVFTKKVNDIVEYVRMGGTKGRKKQTLK